MAKTIQNIATEAELISIFSDTDIGVVSALQLELDSLIALAKEHIVVIGPNRTYHKLSFDSNGKEFAVVAYTSNKMGISAMAITLMEIIHVFKHLKFIGLIGIAAGSDSSEQKFGNLLIPNSVYNYEMGKYSETEDGKIEFKSDFSSYNFDKDLLEGIHAALNDQELLHTIWQKSMQQRAYRINMHPGNLACGSAVIASILKIKELEHSIGRKYIGLDMESYAVASINELRFNPYPKLFVIKAISDFADKAKDDVNQSYARFISASAFVVACSLVLVTKPINRAELDDRFKGSYPSVKETDFVHYKTLAKRFDEISIEDKDKRVREKTRQSRILGEFIIDNHLVKSDVAELYSEGALIGLTISIFLKPEENDKKFLFIYYRRVDSFFAKHKIIDSVSRLINEGFIKIGDMSFIKDTIEKFLQGADDSMKRKLDQFQIFVDKKFIIKKYSEFDEKLKMGINMKVALGNPKPQLMQDAVFQSVVYFEGYYEDAMDIFTDSNGKLVTEIEYTYVSFERFTMYACVRCKNLETEVTRERWVRFTNEIVVISTQPGATEKEFPVEARELYQGWKEVNVNLKNCVHQLFGMDNLEYLNLVKMRIRGSGKLANIILR